MGKRYFEDPTGIARDVLYEVDEKTERSYAEKADDKIEAVLDAAVGAGRIRTDARDEWRGRLRREPELAREILESLRENRDFAERAASQDSRIVSLGLAWDRYLGVEAVEVSYEDDGLPHDPTGLLALR